MRKNEFLVGFTVGLSVFGGAAAILLAVFLF